MIPSKEQVERWADHSEPGWVKIPSSSWDGLMWVLERAEEAEKMLTADPEKGEVWNLKGAAYEYAFQARMYGDSPALPQEAKDGFKWAEDAFLRIARGLPAEVVAESGA